MLVIGIMGEMRGQGSVKESMRERLEKENVEKLDDEEKDVWRKIYIKKTE